MPRSRSSVRFLIRGGHRRRTPVGTRMNAATFIPRNLGLDYTNPVDNALVAYQGDTPPDRGKSYPWRPLLTLTVTGDSS